jgi:hypothetical protein
MRDSHLKIVLRNACQNPYGRREFAPDRDDAWRWRADHIFLAKEKCSGRGGNSSQGPCKSTGMGVAASDLRNVPGEKCDASLCISFFWRPELTLHRQMDAWKREKGCVKIYFAVELMCNCRRVELRALCNEVPRTPPGPEGSNGTGLTECAAGYPRFLSFFCTLRWKIAFFTCNEFAKVSDRSSLLLK